ncbi:MAG: hypothetical protein ACTHK7_12805 [Aureliella sp.]
MRTYEFCTPNSPRLIREFLTLVESHAIRIDRECTVLRQSAKAVLVRTNIGDGNVDQIVQQLRREAFEGEKMSINFLTEAR